MIKQLSSFLKPQQAAGAVVVVAQAAPAETPTEEETPTETEQEQEQEQTATETAATATVSISQERLAQLETAERELTEMRPKYEILNTWYETQKGAGAAVGQDARDATASGKKSWQTAPWNQ